MQFIRPTQALRDAAELCKLAREILGGLMQCEAGSLPTDVALRDLGVDSRMTVALIAALSTQLSRPLAPTLIYAHPTLEALARRLTREEDEVGGGSENSDQVERDLPEDEPIALIGIGCRFPGGASHPKAYFELLQSGIDAVIEAPEARTELRGQDDAPLRGGFLEDVAGFDEAFFGISPREASEMDPQQRLMLEVSWEALEDAGVSPSELEGSRTGVFVGAMWQDYAHHSAAIASSIEQHTVTGLDTSVIAARISYRLGLRGPSLTVNTACSSALVAVHLACQSLRQRERAVALAGGVNMILSPHSSVAMARFGALSPDSRCKAFDASAMATCAAKAQASSSSSGCPMRSQPAIPSTASFAVARSTTTARATGSRRRAAQHKLKCCATRTRVRGSHRRACITWRPMARYPRGDPRSKPRRSARCSAAAAPPSARVRIGSVRPTSPPRVRRGDRLVDQGRAGDASRLAAADFAPVYAQPWDRF